MARLRPHPYRRKFRTVGLESLWARLYRIFFKTYTEKVWGIPCTEIRAEWAAQRIQGLSLAKAIRNATSLNRRAETIKTLISRFRYPRLGPGQMWERCAERIEEMGGRVLTRARCDVVRAWVRTELPPRWPWSTEKNVVSRESISLPRFRCRRWPGRSITHRRMVRNAGDNLSYRDFVLVAPHRRPRHLFPDNWIYVHTPGVSVGRIQNFNNWSADMVPVEGVTCIGMEYFCFEGDGLWESDNCTIDRAGRERAGRPRPADGRPALSRPARSIVIVGFPETVTFEAEILHADAGHSFDRNHVGTPVVEILNPADGNSRRVYVDPVVRKQIGRSTMSATRTKSRYDRLSPAFLTFGGA